MVGNSPLKHWKQDTYVNGNTDLFIVSWPAKIKDSKFHYVHNHLKLEQFAVSSAKTLPAEKRALSDRFKPTDKCLKPNYFIGSFTLSVNGL